MKHLVTILFILIPFASFSQVVNPYLGTPNTITLNRGYFKSDSGVRVSYNFPDTISANRGLIKNQPNIIITVNDTLWKRSNDATFWMQVGSGGGGGGPTIYTGDGSLNGDRTVDLNGHSITFNNGPSFLVSSTGAAGSNYTSQLQASNLTGLGNGTTILADAGDADAKFSFLAAFNDGATSATILGQAQSGSSSIAYTADTHTFNGNVLISNLVTGGSAPATAGTRQTVSTDGNGLLSFINKTFSALTFGATTTWDYTTGYSKTLLLTGDANLVFSNVQDGDQGTLIVIQDGTGGHELTVPDDVLTINSAAGDTTVLGWLNQGGVYYWATSVASTDTTRVILNQYSYRQAARAEIDSINVSALRIRTNAPDGNPLSSDGADAFKWPVTIETIDTNAANIYNTPGVYTAYIRKVLRFPSNVRSQYHIGLHGGIRYEVTDSANIYSTGGDFGASIQAENEYNELSSSGEVRIQGGTVVGDVVPAIYGGHVVRTFTTGVHFRGYWGGFNTYFNNGGVNRDTVDHWIAYTASSTQAMKHYDTWTGLYITPPGLSVVTNAWNVYAPQSNGRSLFAGQVGIGSSGLGTFTAPSFNASALLILSSTTQGFLPPVMNTTQMNAISSPATGLIIWNSDSLALCKYNGSAWLKAEGSGGGSGNLTVGTSTITSGTNGRVLYDNSGVLGEMTTSGSGTQLALTNSPTITTPVISSITNTGTLTLPTVTGTVSQYVVTTISSNATWSPAGDARDNVYIITAQAAAVTTISNPTGGASRVDGNILTIRVKDNGTARALSWSGSEWRASPDLPLPSTTVLSKTMYIKFMFNATDTKWDLIGVLNNFGFDYANIIIMLVLAGLTTYLEKRHKKITIIIILLVGQTTSAQTRFYMQKSVTSPASPTVNAAWNVTTGNTYTLAMPNKLQGHTTTQANVASGASGAAAPRKMLALTLITQPLVAQTISSGSTFHLQSGASANGSITEQQLIYVRVCDEDGSNITEVGNATGSNISTSNINHRTILTLGSDVTINDNQRLIFELGGNYTVGSATTITITYSVVGVTTTGTDLADADSGSGNGIPWIECSQTLKFRTCNMFL